MKKESKTTIIILALVIGIETLYTGGLSWAWKCLPPAPSASDLECPPYSPWPRMH